MPPRLSKSFIAESKLLMELDHENIVQAALRVAREGDVFFCAMEKHRGAECALQDSTIGEDRRLDEDDSRCRVPCAQVALALGCVISTTGVLVHRDIKPGNIMWDSTDAPRNA